MSPAAPAEVLALKAKVLALRQSLKAKRQELRANAGAMQEALAAADNALAVQGEELGKLRRALWPQLSRDARTLVRGLLTFMYVSNQAWKARIALLEDAMEGRTGRFSDTTKATEALRSRTARVHEAIALLAAQAKDEPEKCLADRLGVSVRTIQRAKLKAEAKGQPVHRRRRK